MIKRAITPLLSLILLYAPCSHSHFSEGFVVGGVAGLTAGIITTAVARPQPNVVVVSDCPIRRCTGCTSTHCTQRRLPAQPRVRRQHSKKNRRHLPKRTIQPCSLRLKRQEQTLLTSIKDLEVLKASLSQESKRIELIIKKMELKLQETELRLEQAAKKLV